MNELNDMRGDVLGWIDRARVAPGRYRYTLDPSTQPVLYNTLYAVLALEFFDALREQDEAERDATIAYIRSFQEPDTGWFRDASVQYAGAAHDADYTRWHVTGTALQALDALGVRPHNELAFLEEFRSVQSIREWLSGLEMRHAWRDSNRIMSLLGSLYFQLDWRGGEEWRSAYHAVLDWLDAAQDPRTGLWGTDHGAGVLRGMAAAYHFLMFYYAVDRPVRHAERIIDSTLSLQVREGNFLPFGGSTCLDLDAMEILIGLSMATDHRLDDIRHAGRRLRASILRARNADGGFGEHSTTGFRPGHLVPLALSLLRHRCVRTWGFQTRQLVKHTLLKDRRMYAGSIVQCGSDMYESTIWGAWFRPLAVAIVDERFPEPGARADGFRPVFRRLPGLGYSGVAALVEGR